MDCYRTYPAPDDSFCRECPVSLAQTYPSFVAAPTFIFTPGDQNVKFENSQGTDQRVS